MINLKEDTFLNGIIFGVISVIITYFLVYYANYWWTNVMYRRNFLYEYRLQAVVLMLNMIILRIVMVNLKKDEAGRAMLLVITFSTFAYLGYHKYFH